MQNRRIIFPTYCTGNVAIGYLNLRRKKRIVKFFADIRSVPAQIVLLLHISDASRTNNFHHLLPARVEDFFAYYHFLAKLKILLFKYNYPPLFGLFINSDQWHHFSETLSTCPLFLSLSMIFCRLDYWGSSFFMSFTLGGGYQRLHTGSRASAKFRFDIL